MSDRANLASQVSRIFDMDGGSLRDYALVASMEPPAIVRTSTAIGLLEIEDSALAEACANYLAQQGARTFQNFEDLKSLFGIGVRKWTFPAGIMIFCDECVKHFEVVLTSKRSRKYRCPNCGKSHLFKFANSADEKSEPGDRTFDEKCGSRRFRPSTVSRKR